MVKTKFPKLKPPLTDKDIRGLKTGDTVLISGKIYAARDAAHKLFEKNLPFDPKGAVLFYASPTPARPGKPIGSIGPTTATRMDPFTPRLLKQGVKLTIGKGKRGPEVIAAMKKYKAAYLVVPGGAAAALSKYVRRSTVIAFPDLGPEAVLELEVVDFPAIVAIDCRGSNLFETGKRKYASK
ncbi:MAG: FumA C-terminus/TtdB family hydratase beta subunit [Candidatus Margulisbacteria bacterium]|nr:FumA C-terminus/TtdB family hydratase beta subunit [Candidatus Margulisiibacteriota bacterium]